MEERDYELFDTLKKRPDKDPDIEFSKQLRQSLQKKPIKKTKFSIATVLTIPVTLAVLLFVFIIGTGQSIKLKNAALLTINQENNLTNILCVVLMLALLLFILFVYYKGLTKGRLVYLTFSLSFIAWVGNLLYAENQNIEEPSYSEFYDDNEMIGSFTNMQERLDEILKEQDNYLMKTIEGDAK